jgi:outer membrane receptor protein involved in Fe transport
VAKLTLPNNEFNYYEPDWERGGSLEWDHPMGANLLTFSVDKTLLDIGSSEYFASGGNLVKVFGVTPGSSIATTSVLLRALMNASDRLSIVPALYYNAYDWRTSLDGGTTWTTRGLGHFDPRLGITYRTTSHSIVRFAVGSSIAPPYLSALGTSAAVTPRFISNLPPFGSIYEIQTGNAGLRPETAFGYDLGTDFRLGDRETIASADLYTTTLSNQFFTQYKHGGNYNDGTDGTLPLYLLTPSNLSRARYDGVEFTLKRRPNVGVGFVFQGSLQRAYPYGLAPGLYGPPNGPQTSNLTLVPSINYQYGVGNAGGTPYSQGYGELNYRGVNGLAASFGETYVGPNNTYVLKPFFMANATLRLPLRERLSLQVAAQNLFNYYSGWISPYLAGYPKNLTVQVNNQAQVVPTTALPPRTIRTSLSYRI